MATNLCKVDGRSLAPIRRRLLDMQQRAGNLQAAWQEFATWYADQNRLHWSTRGARWRTPWPELSPRYLADKRSDGWTGDTLVRTTNLMRSMTDRPLNVERMSAHEMTAGTRVKYARYHQYGTRHMPARKLVNARQVRDEGALSSVVASWIVRGIPVVRAREAKR